MADGLALALSRQMLWQALFIASPVVLTLLVCGLLVSVFQVITQIQDATVSAAPKLLAAALILMLCGEWMLQGFMRFATAMFSAIPDGVS